MDQLGNGNWTWIEDPKSQRVKPPTHELEFVQEVTATQSEMP